MRPRGELPLTGCGALGVTLPPPLKDRVKDRIHFTSRAKINNGIQRLAQRPIHSDLQINVSDCLLFTLFLN